MKVNLELLGHVILFAVFPAAPQPQYRPTPEPATEELHSTVPFGFCMPEAEEEEDPEEIDPEEEPDPEGMEEEEDPRYIEGSQ